MVSPCLQSLDPGLQVNPSPRAYPVVDPNRKYLMASKSLLLTKDHPLAESRLTEALYKELQLHQNTLVLDQDKVAILVGILDVEDDDYYWALRLYSGDTAYLSCVGSPVFLWPGIPSSVYRQIHASWVWNPDHALYLNPLQ